MIDGQQNLNQTMGDFYDHLSQNRYAFELVNKESCSYDTKKLNHWMHYDRLNRENENTKDFVEK